MRAGVERYSIESQEVQIFLSLLATGLWEKTCGIFIGNIGEGVAYPESDAGDPVNLSPHVDWDSLIKLSREQAVLSLVGSGMDYLRLKGVVFEDLSGEQNKAIIRNVMSTQEYSGRMEGFISKLFASLQRKGFKPVLLKGMGVAQCYVRPELRSLGDVDILLNGDEYDRGVDFVSPHASKVFDEDKYDRHIQMIIGKVYVELHGTMHVHLGRKTDSLMDHIQETMFKTEAFRMWSVTPSCVIPLPGPTEDVLYIFCHILQHLTNLGIGLKQVCDLCRLIYTNRDKIDENALRAHLEQIGYIEQWRTFAVLMEEYLCMPKGVIPFTGPNVSLKYRKKARRLMEYILHTGNMGKNRDVSYRRKSPYLIKKVKSLGVILQNAVCLGRIFPGYAFRYALRGISKGAGELAVHRNE